ncbi:MAG: ATP-binding cassette domain-containing protein [Phycisphaeraceae bacterium]
MQLTLHHTLPTAVQPSPNVLRVAAMFGLGLDAQRRATIIPPTTLTLQGGQVVFITGASGGGKSTLLRLIADAATARHAKVIRFDELAPPADRPLIDGFADRPLEEVTALLSLAGLNDAWVMLRTPAELSDGQRYRLRLAHAIAKVSNWPEKLDGAQRRLRFSEAGSNPTQPTAPPLTLILADEFAATLDRLTAAIIARNVRRWTRRPQARQVCFIAATTHDDLLEALEPDVLIEKHPGARIEIATRAAL